MQRKDMTISIRMTESELKTLKRKARKSKMAASEYVRAMLIHSDDLNITMVDMEPLEKLAFELQRQGVNLNELTHRLNTHGKDAYNESSVSKLLERRVSSF